MRGNPNLCVWLQEGREEGGVWVQFGDLAVTVQAFQRFLVFRFKLKELVMRA